MVREWFMRRGLSLLAGERACDEVNLAFRKKRLLAAGMRRHLKQLGAFYFTQNIHQRFFDFVVTCR